MPRTEQLPIQKIEPQEKSRGEFIKKFLEHKEIAVKAIRELIKNNAEELPGVKYEHYSGKWCAVVEFLPIDKKLHKISVAWDGRTAFILQEGFDPMQVLVPEISPVTNFPEIEKNGTVLEKVPTTPSASVSETTSPRSATQTIASEQSPYLQNDHPKKTAASQLQYQTGRPATSEDLVLAAKSLEQDRKFRGPHDAYDVNGLNGVQVTFPDGKEWRVPIWNLASLMRQLFS